jgi:fermentation-respiration switch protein FrsA (DUF1100 family)
MSRIHGWIEMRQDIMFMSCGLRCSGWLYLPDTLASEDKVPAIVMAHGYSAVKEMYLSNYAERFADAGFITLVFDYRYFGDSKGEPRGQLFPLEQQEDYRNAITWISDHPHVDPQRIGIWGTSYSGGLVLYVGIFDKRVKAIVAQAPSAMNWETRRGIDPERFDKVGELLIQDRINRYRTGTINYINVVAPEGEPCVLSQPESYAFLMEASKHAPNWRNQITFESLEKQREFDPISLIHLIAPTPLLIIAAEHDTLIPLDAPVSAYQRALEPKSLKILPCSHFDVYTEPWIGEAARAAVDWLKSQL